MLKGHGFAPKVQGGRYTAGMPLSPRRRFLVRGALVALAVLGIAAAFVVVGVYPPTAGSFYPKCASYTLLGLHCPGCGLTRAVHAALNGRFAEALSQNVLVLVAVPYLLWVAGTELWRFLWQTPHRPRRWRWGKWVTVAVFTFAGLYTVARNIPVEPFTLLAPHELPPPGEHAP